MTATLETPPTMTERPKASLLSRIRPARGLTNVVVLALLLAITYPLLRLVDIAFRSDGVISLGVFGEVLTSKDFLESLGATLAMVIPAAIIAVGLGILFAWSNSRTNASLGAVGQVLPLTTFVVPHLAVSSGWLLLGAPGVGLLKSRLEDIPIIGPLFPSIYGLPGMTFVMVLTMVPFVFIVLQSAFANLDPALEEASMTSGAGPLRTFFKVSVPSMRSAIAASALLAVVVGMGEYTIPLVLGTPAGVRTLSVLVLEYATASYPPKLAEAAVIGIVVLLVVAVMWLLYYRTTKSGRYSQIGGKSSARGIVKLGGWRYVVWAIIAFYFLCATLLPLAGLLVVSLQPYWNPSLDPSQWSFNNIQQVINSAGVSGAILNSLKFAAIGAASLTIIVMFLTSANKVLRSRMASVGLAVVKIPAAVATVVLAVGILAAYFGPPFSLGGTQLILVGAYVMILLPHGSILGEAATAQVRQELVEASQVAGASWWRTQMRILLPLTASGFIAMFALVFALMTSEVSASRVLASPGTSVIGYTLVQVYNQSLFGTVAVLSLFVAVMNLIAVGGLLLLSRMAARRW